MAPAAPALARVEPWWHPVLRRATDAHIAAGWRRHGAFALIAGPDPVSAPDGARPGHWLTVADSSRVFHHLTSVGLEAVTGEGWLSGGLGRAPQLDLFVDWNDGGAPRRNASMFPRDAFVVFDELWAVYGAPNAAAAWDVLDLPRPEWDALRGVIAVGGRDDVRAVAAELVAAARSLRGGAAAPAFAASLLTAALGVAPPGA